MSYFFKDELHLDPTSLSMFDTLTSWIWLLKPLMGFVVDSFAICDSKKASYLLIFSTVQIVGWLSLSMLVDNFWSAVLAKLLINLASGFINVIGEALMVQLSNHESGKQKVAAKNVSWYLSLTAACMLLSSLLGGYLLEALSVRQMFAISALFPLVTVAAACIVSERPLSNSTEKKTGFCS